ncbi:MAG: HAD family phosphatase [bacterium]|nr:HAD family phosphatase [bacterium]
MPVKWIISDLDGCVNPEESVAWDLEAFARFAAVVREASAGHGTLAPMTICTGRPQPYVEALTKILDVRAPVICENGAVLYTLHDNWSRYGPGVTEEKVLGLRAVRAFVETEILPHHPEAVLQFGKEAQMSVFSSDPGLFPEMKARIDAFVTEHDGPELVINASPCYLNISLAGVDKGSTLRALLDELGVTGDETAGIGDSEGDLPLRETVGFFACPANASQCIKDAADYVSPHRDINGMLDILARPEMQRASGS